MSCHRECRPACRLARIDALASFVSRVPYRRAVPDNLFRIRCGYSFPPCLVIWCLLFVFRVLAITCSGEGASCRKPPDPGSGFWKRAYAASFSRHHALLIFWCHRCNAGIALTLFCFTTSPGTCSCAQSRSANLLQHQRRIWTRDIEERSTLLFSTLYLRSRWGWGLTLIVCALARLVWFGFSICLCNRNCVPSGRGRFTLVQWALAL